MTGGVTLSLPHGPAWPNSYALAPLTNKQSHADGTLAEDEHRWLRARAEGGFGLVMTCAAYVSDAGKAWHGQLGIASDAHLPGLTRLATSLREAGAVSSVQLHHGGRRASSEVSGVPTKAPWDDESTGATALSTAEVHEAVADFVAGAVRAERAGFDGVELHGAHGYLIGQFLDARSNHRQDGYGGSLEDRSRFLREVLEGVRGATGPDFQVGLRLTPERMGIELGEFREVAGSVLASGRLDYLDVSMWDVRKAPHDTERWDGLLVDHVVDLPRHGARLGLAGEIKSAADAAWCLSRGADFVLVATGATLHHDFARRAVADAGFRAVDQPVTRQHLAAEAVGPVFVDYLAENWDDFVA
ncbi:NADH-dependent flavin oxidoreductase [Nocardioides aquaticus]